MPTPLLRSHLFNLEPSVDEYSTPKPLSRARYKRGTEYLDIAEPGSTISEKKCIGSVSVSVFCSALFFVSRLSAFPELFDSSQGS